MVTVINLPPPPFCEREALRYAGCRMAEKETLTLLRDCFTEVRDKLIYKVCYQEMPVNIRDSVCDIGGFSVYSEKLAKNLSSCRSVLLMGATVGVELDRLIARYGRLSPARALLFQAIGAERIEALCDTFCREYAEENGVQLKPRFSPGYGDLPLETQKAIFAVLDCPRKIGLSLNDSLLMSPSKSVTAFVGITAGEQTHETKKCDRCDNIGCSFRSIV